MLIYIQFLTGEGRHAAYHGTGWKLGGLSPGNPLCDFEIPSESPIEAYQATLTDLFLCACNPPSGKDPYIYSFVSSLSYI